MYITTTRTLLVTSATLVVTGALLVVTMFAIRNKKLLFKSSPLKRLEVHSQSKLQPMLGPDHNPSRLCALTETNQDLTKDLYAKCFELEGLNI